MKKRFIKRENPTALDKAALAKALAKPELKEVVITASYTGKISTGSFENESPFFSLQETWSGNMALDRIAARQEFLSRQCYDKFLECENRAMIERIQRQRKDIRFYPVGKESYPSITSIIGWDKDFFISEEDLVQYAARGTIFHKQAEIYLNTGVWKEANDIPEVHRELVVVKKGSLSLNIDGYGLEGFCSKYKLVTADTEQVSYNHTHKYAGRRDWKGTIDGVPSLVDWKTSQKIDKNYALQQLAAHLHCPDNDDVQQVMAVPVNNDTVQKFSKPLVMKREELEDYWQAFLRSRENFKYRFGC